MKIFKSKEMLKTNDMSHFVNTVVVMVIIFLLYNIYLSHNIEKKEYMTIVSSVLEKSNTIVLNNVVSNTRNSVRGLAQLLEENMVDDINKNNGNSIDENIFDTINEIVPSLGLKKNTLIIGTLNKIIYNNSLDEFKTNEWGNIFDLATLTNIFNGNVNRVYVKHTDGEDLKVVDEKEVLNLVNNNPSALTDYEIIIPIRITPYGDITGNTDIHFDAVEETGISPYKICVLYRQNLSTIYLNNMSGFNDINIANSNNSLISYFLIIIITIAWIFVSVYRNRGVNSNIDKK